MTRRWKYPWGGFIVKLETLDTFTRRALLNYVIRNWDVIVRAALISEGRER